MHSADNIERVVIDGCRVERCPQQHFSTPVIFRYKVEKFFESYHPDPENAFRNFKCGTNSKGSWPGEMERIIDGFTIQRVMTIGTPFKYKIKEKNEFFNSNSSDIGIAFYRHSLNGHVNSKAETTSNSIRGGLMDQQFPWGSRSQSNFNFGGIGSGGFAGSSSIGLFSSSKPSGTIGSSTENTSSGGHFVYTPPQHEDVIEKDETSSIKDECI